ncbi:MAG: MarR family transcriptional regulator [Pirellulaceae bacterium]|nr:MarR family transcriptional regulator [Pirellulaceae bacterium]
MPHENNLRADAETIEELLHSFLDRLAGGNHDGEAIDLPLAQLRLCNSLFGKARSMSSISRELGTSLSAVTQIADRLERAGLVKRVPRGDDRRVRCLELTDSGAEMMRRHAENRVRRMAEVLARLSTPQRQTVADAFTALVEAADETVDRKTTSNTMKIHYDTAKVRI